MVSKFTLHSYSKTSVIECSITMRISHQMVPRMRGHKRVFRTRAEQILSLVRTISVPSANSDDESSDDDGIYDDGELNRKFSDSDSSDAPDISHLDDFMRDIIEEEELDEDYFHANQLSQNNIVPVVNDGNLQYYIPDPDTVFTDLLPLDDRDTDAAAPLSQHFETASDLPTEDFLGGIPVPIASSVDESSHVASALSDPPNVANTSSDPQNVASTSSDPPNIVASTSSGPQNFTSSSVQSAAPRKRVYRKRGPNPPSTVLQPVPVRTKPKPPNIVWNFKKKSFKYPIDLPNDDFAPCHTCRSPREYFEDFFSHEIFTLMVEQTNLYSVQKTTTSINTNVEEMKTFIALELIMGVCCLPAYTDYWSNELRYPLVCEKMSLKRYQKLRRYIHFADNTLDNGTDPYFKIRPIAEMLRRNFSRIPHEKKMSVDEMMVPYKGKKAGFRKQYLPKKPKKWGFKIFARAGISGIVYDYILYGGQWTFNNSGHQINFPDNELHFGFGPQVVLALAQSIQDKPTSVIFFDNFFTTPLLVTHLRAEYGILSLGTLRSNRWTSSIMKTDKILLKKRGSFDYRSDNRKRLTIVKWADTKCVTLASSFIGHQEVIEKE